MKNERLKCKDVKMKHQLSTIHYSLSTINYKLMKKEIWKMILQLAISILTAIATTLGVTSCMGQGPIGL